MAFCLMWQMSIEHTRTKIRCSNFHILFVFNLLESRSLQTNHIQSMRMSTTINCEILRIFNACYIRPMKTDNRPQNPHRSWSHWHHQDFFVFQSGNIYINGKPFFRMSPYLLNVQSRCVTCDDFMKKIEMLNVFAHCSAVDFSVVMDYNDSKTWQRFC